MTGVGVALIGAAALAFFLTQSDGTGQTESSARLVRIDPAKGEVAGSVPVGRDPSAVAVGESGVWVASRDDGTVSRIDPGGNRIVFAAAAHGKPTDIALSGGSAIVSNGPQEVDGDLSDRERFLAALAETTFDGAGGHVELDRQRQAIAPNYLVQMQRHENALVPKTIRTIERVDDSYGGRFAPGRPLPSRTYPLCKRGNPPPWAPR